MIKACITGAGVAAAVAGYFAWSTLRKGANVGLVERWLWFVSPLAMAPGLASVLHYRPWVNEHARLLPLVLFLAIVFEVLAFQSLRSAPRAAREPGGPSGLSAALLQCRSSAAPARRVDGPRPCRLWPRVHGRPRSRVLVEVPWRTILKILAAAALTWCLLRLTPLVLVLVVAVLIAVLLDPVVQWLERRGLPRGPATVVLTVAISMAATCHASPRFVMATASRVPSGLTTARNGAPDHAPISAGSG